MVFCEWIKINRNSVIDLIAGIMNTFLFNNKMIYELYYAANENIICEVVIGVDFCYNADINMRCGRNLVFVCEGVRKRRRNHMENVKLDLSVKENADRDRNATAIIGFISVNVILAGAYLVEVLKDTRSFASYAVVLFLCLAPTIASVIMYLQKKDSRCIRYISSIGFLCLYAYVMLTTTTDLAFCYIIVFFLAIVVYSDMKLLWGVALTALAVNVIFIVKKFLAGSLHDTAVTNAEIMVACIVLSFLYAILSVRKINQINDANYKKAEADRIQAQELLKTVINVSEIITENISGAANETVRLKESIELTQTAMENLVAGTDDTVKSIAEQKENTKEIDTQIQDVESAVVSVREEIHNAEKNLESGHQVMKELLQQVEVSKSSGELAADRMTELSDYAGRMQDIMGLISSVANQTGMLALNASIEAARAGDAGKGFAVVASRISDLAAQTNRATGDINELIANVANSIEEVNGAMNTLLESSTLQNQYVDDTAEHLKKVRGNTDEIVKQAEQLEQTVDAVIHANTGVMEKIENISALTQEVTAGSNETLESSTLNLERVQKVSDIMVTLGREADRLNDTYTTAQTQD